MSKLVIGCGYLGRRVASRWVEAGHKVRALTRSAARTEELADLGIEPVRGDVTQPETLHGLPPSDSVLYAVALDRSSHQSRREVLVEGLARTLDALMGKVQRFLFISTTSVYGQTDGSRVDETSSCHPTRENGRMALEAEHVVRRHFSAERGGPAANIVRLAGLYGPGRLLRRIEAVQSGEVVSGNPEAWLNLIHVDDAAEAVIACERQWRSGETWLACDDRPIHRREYYELLSRLLHGPPPTFDGGSVVDARTEGLNKRCSNAKLRRELGWSPRYPTCEEGLRQALGLVK
ncbi:MAG: SDR family oxidoreductase [Planctomycetes bacterium]|nr:SDR family oxidoreductase [Planctomycetota bacterium]